MRKLLFIFWLFAFVFSSNKGKATHIAGGEMNYRYLGNNIYEVTLTVYRDCFNGVPPFDNPASIGVFNGNNLLINNLQETITSMQTVQNAINSPCLAPPPNVCYEVAQYIFNITLPSTGGPYTVAYQRCCRNGSVINIANVQGTGATYFAVITPLNSNPVFNSWPPTFLCKDAPLTFDLSATDVDGDSLVYNMSRPYNGGSQTNPQPDPPDNPPYSYITFLAPYSMNDPLGGVPMHIDPNTGILNATPNSTGQYVFSIEVGEYRNGLLIGHIVRDFQVNVVDCPDITVASIYSPTIVCGGLNASFVNTSYNAATYSWFFGDPTSSSDTSHVMNPIYTYPDTGDYVTTLIAYSAMSPDCNDTAQGIVHVYPEFLTDFSTSNVHCSNVYKFTDLSYGLSGTAKNWVWLFGDDSTSNVKNPIHTFDNPGTYDVILISSADSACTDTMVNSIYVLPMPVSDFTVKLDTCNYEITLKNNSLNASASRWDYGDYSTDYFKEGIHKFSNPGTYDISLIVVTDSVCKDTSNLTINIPPLPIPDFSYSVALCDSEVQFTNLSQFVQFTEWQFGDNEISQLESPLHTYTISGTVPVTLIVTSVHQCRVVFNKDIFFISKKTPKFDISVDSCKGEIGFIDLTNRAAFYQWDFGDGVFSQDINPVHTYKGDGSKTIKLIVNPETQCVDSISKTINFELPLGEKVFIPNSFTPNGDGHNDIYSVSIFRPCDIYHLTIYNRWGRKVFETNDAANIQWDGSFDGEKLGEDIYVYIIENGDVRKEGTITIIR